MADIGWPEDWPAEEGWPEAGEKTPGGDTRTWKDVDRQLRDRHGISLEQLVKQAKTAAELRRDLHETQKRAKYLQRKVDQQASVDSTERQAVAKRELELEQAQQRVRELERTAALRAQKIERLERELAERDDYRDDKATLLIHGEPLVRARPNGVSAYTIENTDIAEWAWPVRVLVALATAMEDMNALDDPALANLIAEEIRETGLDPRLLEAIEQAREAYIETLFGELADDD